MPYQSEYNADGSPTDPSEKARRQALIQQRVFQQQAAQRGGQQEQPQPAPQPQQPQQPQQQQPAPQVQRGGGNEMGDAPIQMPGMNPAAHFGAHNKMIAATNAAIATEMNSRRAQAAAHADRQHEYQMEVLRQQGRQQQQSSQPQQESESQLDQVRKARNRSLMAKAGLGGHTITGGRNGVTVKPHPYGNNPFASALLGD